MRSDLTTCIEAMHRHTPNRRFPTHPYSNQPPQANHPPVHIFIGKGLLGEPDDDGVWVVLRQVLKVGKGPRVEEQERAELALLQEAGGGCERGEHLSSKVVGKEGSSEYLQ